MSNKLLGLTTRIMQTNSKTIGYTIDGVEIEYKPTRYTISSSVALYLSNERLKEITIADGVTGLYINNNHLIELELPLSLIELCCSNNNLIHLDLTPNLKRLLCDKELFDYAECKVKNVDIYY